MRINNNISALNAWRGLTNTDNSLSKSLEKLSSGLRINRAGDDAAGLAISEKMRGQIRGLNMAMKNAQDGISLIQTAEGALTETHAILQRMRELTVQAANGTNEAEDLTAIQNEIAALIEELGGEGGSKGVSDRTGFNGKTLLDGTYETASGGSTLHFQIGANQTQQVALNIEDMSAAGLEVNGIDVTKFATNDPDATDGFDAQLDLIDTAIKDVSTERSKLGAMQNRLEHTIKNLGVATENLAAAESRIRDVDMAQEMMNFTKQNILMQAGTAMLAQANARPQSVLQLLG